jgi:hypothetical protein
LRCSAWSFIYHLAVRFAQSQAYVAQAIASVDDELTSEAAVAGATEGHRRPVPAQAKPGSPATAS